MSDTYRKVCSPYSLCSTIDTIETTNTTWNIKLTVTCEPDSFPPTYNPYTELYDPIECASNEDCEEYR